MDGQEAIKILSERWSNAEALRNEYPEISDLLAGEFGKEKGEYKFNVHKEGGVVSRPLDGKTVGVILPGKEYDFPTDKNTEVMLVLDGKLTADVNAGPSSVLQKYGSITGPAKTTLYLKADKNVFYLCQYKPKK